TTEKPTELSYNPHMPLSQALLLPRIVIENTMPTLDGGQFAVKAVVGQDVVVTSKVYADGHDRLAVRVRWRTEGDEVWHSEVMTAL
ncbi:alpha-1,4-glucan--maltose-1-phosphate maltosyltransferase, partial [Pseudomonas sp. MWU12-2312b]